MTTKSVNRNPAFPGPAGDRPGDPKIGENFGGFFPHGLRCEKAFGETILGPRVGWTPFWAPRGRQKLHHARILSVRGAPSLLTSHFWANSRGHLDSGVRMTPDRAIPREKTPVQQSASGGACDACLIIHRLSEDDENHSDMRDLHELT